MATYNPYNLSRAAAPPTPAPNGGRFNIARQAPLTQNAQEEEDQNLQGLRTGQFADVQSAAGATQRANALRTSQSLQAARGTVARAGDALSPEAALRAQDQAFASAGAQNLQADNAVNQLQRQYRQDALNRAGGIEDRAYGQANNERAYQTDASRYADDQAWKGYDANVAADNNQFSQNYQLQQADRSQSNTDRDYTEGTRRFDLGRQDQLGSQAEDTRRFDLSRGDQNSQFAQTFGANRQDAAFNQGLAKDQFSASREDAADNRNRFDLSRGDQNSQFNQSFGANREDAADNRSRFDLSRADSNNQFAQTFGANRQDAADNRDRFDLSRQDSNSQFGQTFGANRQDAAFNQGLAKDQFSANRADTAWNQQNTTQQQADDRSRYDLSRQDSNNQFNQTFGANRQDAAFDQSYKTGQAADDRSRFDLTRQDANNQYQQNYAANRQDASFDQNYRTGQAAENTRQFDQTRMDSNSQFALNREDQQAQNQYQQGRDTLADNRYSQQYADQRGDVAYDRTNAQRLETKTDALAAIDSIQDPKARNAAYAQYMQGANVTDFISKGIYNPDGSVNETYRSQSPGQQAYQAQFDELKSTYPNKSDSEIGQMVQDRAQKADQLTTSATDTSLQQNADDAAAARLAKGGVTTPADADLATLTPINPTSIPRGSDTAQWLSNNKTGGWVSISGEPLKVTGGLSVRDSMAFPGSGSSQHTDFVVAQTKSGQKIWIDANGNQYTTNPESGPAQSWQKRTK